MIFRHSTELNGFNLFATNVRIKDELKKGYEGTKIISVKILKFV